MSNHRARLAGAASMLAALALTATALPTMAADNDILTVSGSTTTTLELEIVGDDAADFGAMSPDGTATAEASTTFTDAAGACYVWDNGVNNINVRSNVTYDLERDVTGTDRANLRFEETVPASKAACTGGDPVTDAGLNGDWYASQSPTTGDTFTTRLWVDLVNWTDPAFSVGTTITFTATAS